eukprot:5824247-Prorocentrum_lima.AAC.1
MGQKLKHKNRQQPQHGSMGQQWQTTTRGEQGHVWLLQQQWEPLSGAHGGLGSSTDSRKVPGC